MIALVRYYAYTDRLGIENRYGSIAAINSGDPAPEIEAIAFIQSELYWYHKLVPNQAHGKDLLRYTMLPVVHIKSATPPCLVVTHLQDRHINHHKAVFKHSRPASEGDSLNSDSKTGMPLISAAIGCCKPKQRLERFSIIFTTSTSSEGPGYDRSVTLVRIFQL